MKAYFVDFFFHPKFVVVWDLPCYFKLKGVQLWANYMAQNPGAIGNKVGNASGTF
jgi:hypothetical protein